MTSDGAHPARRAWPGEARKLILQLVQLRVQVQAAYDWSAAHTGRSVRSLSARGVDQEEPPRGYTLRQARDQPPGLHQPCHYPAISQDPGTG